MYSCETVWVKQGACITRTGAVRNYSKNTIMEKNKRIGRGSGYGIFRGIEEIASGFSMRLIKNNMEYSSWA